MPSKYRSKYIILTVFTVLLTSCSTSIERFKTVNNDERKNQANQYSEDQKATFKGAYSNYWIVSSDETLEFIARSTGVPLEDIAYYNSLSYPYKLNDGMRLYIAKESWIQTRARQQAVNLAVKMRLCRVLTMSIMSNLVIQSHRLP